MEMVIEIELRILRPTGTMQQCGNFDESSAKLRNQVETILHEAAHLRKGVPVGCRRRVEHAGHADVHGKAQRTLEKGAAS
jgi:outer membrane protein OmpA-like peptidoglycan-associated protein